MSKESNQVIMTNVEVASSFYDELTCVGVREL